MARAGSKGSRWIESLPKTPAGPFGASCCFAMGLFGPMVLAHSALGQDLRQTILPPNASAGSSCSSSCGGGSGCGIGNL
jgi:hypothetical protein